MGSGIRTHGLNVIRGICAIKDRPAIRVITSPQHTAEVAEVADEVCVSTAPIYTIREQFEIPWMTRGATLVHSLHYNAPLLHRGALLVSIHDLTHLLDTTYKKMIKTSIYARPMLTLVAARAEHIYTLSMYSKSRIVEMLKVDEAKITVTYCGVSSEFCPRDLDACEKSVRENLGLSRPYILFVGNLKPHKNVRTLLKAFSKIKDESHVYDLLLIGEGLVWRKALAQEAVGLGIKERVHFVSFVDGNVLPAVYRAAQLLVCPSFEEGFGLPVLEAMATGTPVICSRSASLPEVSGDAAVYFDPNNPSELAVCILDVLASDQKQSEMRMLGLVRAKQFQWSDCVRKHHDVYQKFLS